MKTDIRHILGALAIAAMSSQALAQSLPNSFNYQAMINADDGSPIANKDITVEISILQGSGCDDGGTCAILWQELHTPTTNDFGLFNVEIGSSNAINTMTGSIKKYSDIDWLNTSGGYYYMRVRVDFGEASYLNGMTDLGTTKFSSVPYSLAATTAESAKQAHTLSANADGKTALDISQLADVTVVNPQKNQILVFDGKTWKNSDPANTQGLTNIDIQNPANGQLLIYNGTSKNWENKPFPALNIESMSNVSVEALNKKDVLAYNGSAWQNTQLRLSSLSDVTGTPANGQVLTYNSGTWSPATPAAGDTKTTSIYDLTKDVKINKLDLKDGHVLTFNEPLNLWEARVNENIWTKGTTNYYTSKRIGVGAEIVPDVNGSSVLMMVATSSSSTSGTSLFSGKGITIGCSKDRVKGSGSIALGAGGAGDVQGASCIVGNGATAEEMAENSIVLGNKATSNAINSLVIGANSKARGSNTSVLGSGLQSVGDNSLVIGKYNKYATDQLFAIGDGTSTTTNTCFYIKAGGDGYIQGALTNSSDSRLKTNINTLDNALGNIMKLRGVSFNWDKTKNPNAAEGLQFGFIAQEVEKIFPNLVSENINGYKAVNYTGIIPVLTEAIQDQQTEIEELKKENEELKSALEMLLKRVEALENK